MADKSKILWTDASWNPIVGCSKISPGCQNCYAEKMGRRLAAMGVEGYCYAMTEKGKWSGRCTPRWSALSKPLHWKKPRKIFVCSMGDLFHESVPFEWIDKVFAVMALCPQHTFQVLTKRAERMKEYFGQLTGKYEPARVAFEGSYKTADDKVMWALKVFRNMKNFPLPNVWLGVTAENQEMADKRIPLLLQTPAAKRFVSVEPMLGAVDLHKYLVGYTRNQVNSDYELEFPPLDWVIVGAESGAKMRECKSMWINKLVRQCKEASVPIFVKQIHDTITGKLIKEPTGWPREFPKEIE